MFTILAAMLSMAARDCLGTYLTVAEARGRAVLAGVMDALGDLASLAVSYFGIDALITRGLDAHTILLLGCVCVTSFCGTTLWTRLARGMKAAA